MANNQTNSKSKNWLKYFGTSLATAAVSVGASTGIAYVIMNKEGPKLPKFVVTFKNEDEILETKEVQLGAKAIYTGAQPQKKKPEKYVEYSFAGWDGNTDCIIADMVFQAQFNESYPKYKATFHFDNGQGDEIRTIEKRHWEDEAFFPTDPKKDDSDGKQYAFIGWVPTGGSVDEGNVEYTAQYDSTSIDNKIETAKDESGNDIAIIDTMVIPDDGALTIPNHWGKATVTTINDNAFKVSPSNAGVTKIKQLTLPSTLTKIGNSAFEGQDELTGVVIPNGVTTIGKSAFKGCTSLSTIGFPENEHFNYIQKNCFDGCPLVAINIPDSVWTIDDECFANNLAATTLHIGKKLKTVNWSAVLGCKNLENVTVDSDNENYQTYEGYEGMIFGKWGTAEGTTLIKCMPAYKKDVVVPKDVEIIGEKAFQGCSSQNILFESGSQLKKVSSYAFDQSSFKAVDFTSTNLDSIAPYAFNQCAITLFNTGNELVSIPDNAFCNDEQLTKLILGKSIQWSKIKQSAFVGCKALAQIEVSEQNPNLTTDGNGIIYGLNTDGKWELICCPPACEVDPAKLKQDCVAIGDYAFNGCQKITSFTVPQDVEKIGSNIFSGCENIEDITLNAKINYWYISPSAMEGCTIKNIFVNSENKDLYSDEGVLYAKLGDNNQAGLLRIPPGHTNKINNGVFVIPNQTKLIGDFAMSRVDNLKTVKIPSHITQMGQRIIANTNLETLEVENEWPKWDDSQETGLKGTDPNALIGHNPNLYVRLDVDGTVSEKAIVKRMYDLYNPTAQTNDVEYVHIILNKKSAVKDGVIGESTSKVAACCFVDSVMFDNDVTEIGKNAFYLVSTLKNVILPSGLTILNDRAFYHSSLTEKIILPDSLAVLPSTCFAENDIEDLYLPKNAEQIQGSCFTNCRKLTKISYWPANLTAVGSSAFNGCLRLVEIHFDGTKEQWKEIYSKCQNSWVDVPSNCYVYPKDGQPFPFRGE